MTPLFQTTIEDLLRSHHLWDRFESQIDFHVRFDLAGYQRLVIERHGHCISVAHYFEQNGDLIADPEVEFHHPTWTPTAITQAFGLRREKFSERSGSTWIDPRFHREVSAFLSLWARNLRAQGWIERGQVHDDARA